MAERPQGTKLGEDEIAALVALVRILAEIDGFVTLEESDEMDSIAGKVGKDAFWDAFFKSRKDKSKAADLASCAARVTRPAARALIYSLLLELAASDGVGSDEGSVLAELRSHWALEG